MSQEWKQVTCCGNCGALFSRRQRGTVASAGRSAGVCRAAECAEVDREEAQMSFPAAVGGCRPDITRPTPQPVHRHAPLDGLPDIAEMVDEQICSEIAFD